MRELDCRRAEDLGALAKPARRDLHIARGRGDCRRSDGGADWVEQHVTSARELASDHDESGIEEVDDRGHDAADGVAGVRDGAAGAAIAIADELE